jgi:uncharacterized DUF497 family protein
VFDTFDWDEAKAIANEAKHGVSLADGAEALRLARTWVVREDDRRDYGERRLQCLVADPDVPQLVLMVVVTLRKPTVWLISARPANRKERERYEQLLG